jgi:hypothetical protein
MDDVRPGTVFDAEEEVARKMIAVGYAVAVKGEPSLGQPTQAPPARVSGGACEAAAPRRRAPKAPKDGADS